MVRVKDDFPYKSFDSDNPREVLAEVGVQSQWERRSSSSSFESWSSLEGPNGSCSSGWSGSAISASLPTPLWRHILPKPKVMGQLHHQPPRVRRMSGQEEVDVKPALDTLPSILSKPAKGVTGTKPTLPPAPSHRSRKEKLVLRSFSTENEDDMQLEFGEPERAKIRAGRTRRAISAPESPQGDPFNNGSAEGQESPKREGPLGSPRKYRKRKKEEEGQGESDKDGSLALNRLSAIEGLVIEERSSPKKSSPPGKTKYTKSSVSPSKKIVDLTKKFASLPATPRISVFSANDVRRKLNTALKFGEKGREDFKKMKVYQSKSKTEPILSKVEPPVSSPKLVKWKVRRGLSRRLAQVITKTDEESGLGKPDFRQQPPCSSKKSKEKEEEDLLHSAVGVACLEEVLHGQESMTMQQYCASVIDNLCSVVGSEKENWSENTKNHIQNLLKGENCLVDLVNGQKMRVKGADPFCPTFPVTGIMEDRPSVTFPRISQEELECYTSLLQLGEGFECTEEESEAANLFIDLMETDLLTIARKNKLEGLTKGRREQEEKPLPRVQVMFIPVTYKESENEHGIIVPLDKLVNIMTKNRESQQSDLSSRVLREFPRKTIPGLERKKGRMAESVPAVPLPNAQANIIPGYPNAMKLRSGKKVPFVEMDNQTLFGLPAKIIVSHEPVNLDSSPVKVEKQDDYSRRVEANLRRLEGGEDALFFDLENRRARNRLSRPKPSPQRIPPSNEPSTSKACTTISTATSHSVYDQLSFSTMMGSSSPPSALSPSLVQPMLIKFPELASIVEKKPEELSRAEKKALARAKAQLQAASPPVIPNSAPDLPIKSPPSNPPPYARHRHTQICPPFDNNHCSYSLHFCPYPRAPLSRFCLEHVDDGATVNFERCKYVKGSRECGRFVPKAQLQSLFCDMHAKAIAKARLRKIKPAKPVDPAPVFLNEVKTSLDNAESKYQEDDGSGYQFNNKQVPRVEAINNSSDSDTDEELVVEDYVRQQLADDSDCDDYFSDGELDYNLLKNAGYFTISEVATIYRAKLVKLKELYERERELLKLKFVDARQEFLGMTGNLKMMKLRFTTDPKYISQSKGEYSEEYLQHQIQTTLETRAFMKHGRHKGKRAVLHSQMMKKRQEILNVAQTVMEISVAEKTESEVRVRKPRKKSLLCWFGAGTVGKCTERAIPLSKFCKKHISEDKYQKLFVPCGQKFNNEREDYCDVPVFSEIEKFGCPLHNLLMPVKESAPQEEEKKSKIEEEVDKLMESIGDLSSTTSADTDSDSADADSESDEMVHEMEHLVGDEVVDLDHFREVMDDVYQKGVFETDSEESDDTEEEEETRPPIPQL